MTGKEIVTEWLESRHGCFYGRHEVVGEPCLVEAIDAALAVRDSQLYRLGDELAEARLENAKLQAATRKVVEALRECQDALHFEATGTDGRWQTKYVKTLRVFQQATDALADPVIVALGRE